MFLSGPRPGLDEAEGARLPEALPEVVDAHVHLFPDAVFAALWRWFDAYAWPVRYQLKTPEVIAFLLSAVFPGWSRCTTHISRGWAARSMPTWPRYAARSPA